MDSKDIRDLNKIYMEAVYGGGKKVEKKDTRLVVTAADKKANTKAYQNYKAGNKAYKAADHLGEGKAESPEAEEEKDKKDDNLAGAPNKKGKKKAKRWWDDDGDGKGYEKGEVDGKFPDKDGSKKKKKGHDCASKVKHEEYGMGECIKEMHTLDEDGNVSHYDVLFGHGLEKNVDASTLEVLEGMYHEHAINDEKNMELQEKQKDTPDQVAAVIDMYRSKKGTDAATYDSMHGKKKEAKKERDYAKFERDKMARDAQKSGHPWKHAKGSTTEKEGKKSVKHAHVQDSYDWQTESVEAEKYLETVSQVKDAELQADINRWETLQSKGFSTEEIKSVAWEDFDENYQAMRNPEKEEKKDTRSAKQKRMDSPDRGINSPAFKEFMRQQGMG